jgi:CRISPR-associated protein Cas2
MLVVIAYDIVDDKRRNRIASELRNYGVRVQRSVFECHTDRKEFNRLLSSLETMTDMTEDHIRFYLLCDRDMSGIIIDGTGSVSKDYDYFVV